MPTNDPKPTKAQRQADARAKAAQLRKEQERQAKRNKIVSISVLVVIVLAVVAVVGFTVKSQRDNEARYSSAVFGAGAENVVAPALADVTAPATAQETGGIPVNAAGVGEAPAADDVVVTIYFDFMCPYCGQFDAANSADLEALAAEDGVTIDYRPIAFLDSTSKGTNYSSRTANAAAVVADQDPEHFTAFVTALYENQPSENTSGLSDDKIRDIAVEAGVPAAVADTFTDTVEGTYTVADDETEKTGTWRTFAAWVAAATNQMQIDRGRVGTPTVLIDGEDWPGEGGDGNALYMQGELKSAVEAAVAAKQG
ncbi:thioredoxin domain-containing protein [Cellulomonas sp. DKR-3]|uniref:Thioredoxin domain-containing protein n=1 Tax=Cellulomonas fulva TaxID=2835530 RepID=A0ABS5TVL3_9CELL|nr:thioredoxin domain-containing protein [Cellulomonas fulva]MBT0993156.1 thioredoxin domain-containing protein [Cellulomonas fulva]